MDDCDQDGLLINSNNEGAALENSECGAPRERGYGGGAPGRNYVFASDGSALMQTERSHHSAIFLQSGRLRLSPEMTRTLLVYSTIPLS